MPELNEQLQVNAGADGANDVFNFAYRPVTRRDDNGDIQVMTDQRTGAMVVQNAAGLRRHSVLRKDAWKALESEVIKAKAVYMAVVMRIIGLGLTINDDLGHIVHEWDVQSEIVRPNVSIDGRDPDNRDAPDIVRRAITVPVVHQGFSFGRRTMRAAQLMPAAAIDTSLAMAATQSVAEEFERIMFSGTDKKVSSYATTYGLTNHPHLNTAAVASGAWSAFDGTEANDNITKSVTQFLQMMTGDRFRGPFTLYLEYNNYLEAATRKYNGTNQTPLQHLLTWPMISDIVPVDAEFLAHGTMVGVQETSNVIRWVQEMDVQLVEWVSPDGWTTNFKVVGVAAPRITSDYDGRCGVGTITGI